MPKPIAATNARTNEIGFDSGRHPITSGLRPITSAVSNHSTALKVAGAGLVIGIGAYMFPDAAIMASNAMMSAGAYILDTARKLMLLRCSDHQLLNKLVPALCQIQLLIAITSIGQYVLGTGPSAAEQTAKARHTATQVGVGIGAALVSFGNWYRSYALQN